MNEETGRSEYIVRPALPEDAEAIAGIERASFEAPWPLREYVSELSGNAAAHYVVCEKGGSVAAFAGLIDMVGEGNITRVAVEPACRRLGLGKAAVYELVRTTFLENGVMAHTLEVRASNAPAIALYESLGFRTEGVRKGYYEDNGEDALIMWRTAARNFEEFGGLLSPEEKLRRINIAKGYGLL
jgi:ribosomal-protein-alanine N-acetyltransferase